MYPSMMPGMQMPFAPKFRNMRQDKGRKGKHLTYNLDFNKKEEGGEASMEIQQPVMENQPENN
jgi:hypothetical protein